MSPAEAPILDVQTIVAGLEKRLEQTRQTLGKGSLSDEDVHTARKALKAARATVRLLRPALTEDTFGYAKRALRDAAKPLAATRDSKVMQDTLRGLGKRNEDAMRALDLTGLERLMKDQATKARAALTPPSRGGLARTQRLLRNVRDRIDKLTLLEGDTRADDWAALDPGIRKTYSRGRKRLEKAQRDPRPERFHDWRKRVSDLRYQLETLQPRCPAELGELADQAHRLSDYLGDEHDLTVLHALVTAHRECFQNDLSHHALLALIEQDRQQMRDKAVLLGERLYEQKPKAFVRGIARHWRRDGKTRQLDALRATREP